MDHADHVALLRPAELRAGGEWADLGAGTGAFTLALRELLGPTCMIHAVDKDAGALRELEGAFARRFGKDGGIRTLEADFTGRLQLPALDGVLMANSLHFHRDKVAVLKSVRNMLRTDGSALIVEYNAKKGNPWVPHPISFASLGELAREAGFGEPMLLATNPSSFLREIYSAKLRPRRQPDAEAR